MNSKWEQSNFISLSTFFHEIVHPVKVSLRICDPKIVFNDVAYGSCLSQLGKFLSLIDSFIVINVDALTNESPVLISYVNSLNKSIEILRRSLWLLHLGPTIENEKKKLLCQTGIDIIDNAVGIIDETIKIFFSNNVTSLLQKELCSNILRLYNHCLKVLPSTNSTSVDVNSTHETQMVEKVVGNTPEFSESTNFSQKNTPNVVEEAEILNNQEAFFGDNVAVDSNSMLTPISYHKNIIFSDPSHKKLFDKACKYIKDELNYFAFVKSRKLLLMCLLCNTTMRALKARKHINEKDHLLRRNQASCSNIISNIDSSSNCGSAQNHLIKPVPCIEFAVDSDSPPNFSANPSQPVRKSPIDSVILENIPKSQEPSNFYPKTDINTLKCVNLPSIDELSFSKYLDDVCWMLDADLNCNAAQNSRVLSESLISVPEINLQSDPSENSLLSVMLSANAPALENKRKVHDNAVDLNLSNFDKAMSIATTKDHDDICTTSKQKNIRPSPLTRYQDVSESKLPQFARSSHKEAFRKLKEKISDEVDNFLIHSEPDQKKLKMTCKLCKKYLRASNVEAHIKEREHSQHVTVSNMEEECNKYLEFCPSDRGYQCTVCKEILFRNNYFIKDLLYGHFKSETHRQNEQKFNESFSSCRNVKNNLWTNLLIESESGFMKKDKISDLQLEQHHQCDERYMSHDSSNNDFFSADVPSNIKTFSTLKNIIENGVQSEDCVYRTVERIEPTTENSGLSNASRHFSSGSLEENSLRISGIESDNSSLNNLEAKPVQGAKNVPVLPAPVISFDCRVNPEAFQFSKFSHSTEFVSLIKQIYDEVAYFTVVSLTEKEELQLFCHPCEVSISTIQEVVEHVSKWDHSLNSPNYSFCSTVLSAISTKLDWSFLEPRPKFEDYYCSLCNILLSNEFRSWIEHFQSESHILKFQIFMTSKSDHGDTAQLQNMFGNKSSIKLKNYQSSRVNSHLKASEKCEESYMDCVENINCGSQSHLSAHVKTRNTVTCENSSVTLNPNIDLLSKLDSAIKEGKDGLSDSQNHTTLLETGSKNTSDLPISPDSSKFIYNLSTLTFAHYIHIAQFLRLMQKINDQVNQFLFESHPESRSLRFICELCNESFMTFDAAASHVEVQKHKLNIKLLDSKISSTPAIKQCPWMFLKPCGPWEGFLCSWCISEFSSNSDVWMEHFQSKSHNLKLEPLPTYSNLNPGIDSHFKFENSHVTDKKLEDILTTLNPPRNIKDLPSAVSAQPNYSAVKKAKATPKLSIAPPIPLQNALDSKSIQLSQVDKEMLKTLIADLDFQVNCFLIYCTPGRINKVICRLCLCEPMPVSEVAAHVELRDHCLNLILPLLSEENKIHLDWCSSTRSYNCLLCNTTLSRRFCLFEHFQNEAHQSRLQKLNFDDKNSKSDESFTELENSTFREEQTTNCHALSHATFMKISNLNKNKHVFHFLVLARILEWEVNFFSFEPKKDLHIVCQLCSVSCTGYDSAINHACEEKHRNNVEKNNNEAKVIPWIPKICDDNWKVLWPFPGLRNYFCKVCKKVLPKQILSWIEHFLGKFHSEKLKELCLLASKEKDEDRARGAMAPKNLFQDTFNVQGLQFSSIAHEVQFENLLRKINYQINFFSICAQERSQELILTCKVCNETLFVSEVEAHINEQNHLLNLAIKCENKPNVSVPEINQDDWQFLDFDTSLQGYICSLCADKLLSTEESWAEHFRSEAHRSKVEERQIFETPATQEEFFSETVDGSNDECFDSDIM